LVSKVVSNHNKLVKITKIGFDRSKMPNRFDVYELSVELLERNTFKSTFPIFSFLPGFISTSYQYFFSGATHSCAEKLIVHNIKFQLDTGFSLILIWFENIISPILQFDGC